MIRRIFNVASLISALLLASTLLVWAWSFWADPWKDHLSINSGFHVGVYAGRVDFFSDESGPYHGSIISLSDANGVPVRPYVKRGFGDAFGLYYRHIRFVQSGATLWTLSVSLAYPLAMFAVLPAIWGWKQWRTKRILGSQREGICQPGL